MFDLFKDKLNSYSISWLLEGSIKIFLLGLYDAIKLHKMLAFMLSSKVIRTRMYECLMANIVVLLSSVLILDFIILPFLSEDVRSFFNGAYYVFYIYPIYGISYILSAVWYIDIAEQAYLFSYSEPLPKIKSFQGFIRFGADLIYRCFFIGCFSVQLFMFQYIPHIGISLYFIHLCAFNAFISFEYKWDLRKWTTEQKINYFEEHIFYLLGFGTPLTLIVSFCPKFIGLAIFAFLLPIYIMMSILSHPLSLYYNINYENLSMEDISRIKGYKKIPFKLPIFQFAFFFNSKLLQLFYFLFQRQ